MEIFQEFKDKKVAVLGVGISNAPLIKLLLRENISVTAYDENKNLETKELEDMGCNFVLGENFDINEKIIFRTPGILPTYPALQNAIKKGACITSEIEYFAQKCPCKIFAITGSDGKTTTSTITAEILKNSEYTVHLGGNIGTPLLDRLAYIKPSDMVVLELSSFQLMDMNIHPHIAIITNISPNHLDKHTDLFEYENAKKNIYKNMQKDDVLVINFDDNYTHETLAKKVFFSMEKELKNGVFLKENTVFLAKNGHIEKLFSASDIKIPGKHNIANFMAAICICQNYINDDVNNFIHVVKTFSGVSHRLEFVRKLDDISYYNDSIASSPNRTIAGLDSFNQKVILIAGGRDKAIGYDEIAFHIKDKVKLLVLIGETAKKISDSCLKIGFDNIIFAENLENAIITAKNNAEKGDIVLLSPASTSFDAFKNFEHRGNYFMEIVNSL